MSEIPPRHRQALRVKRPRLLRGFLLIASIAAIYFCTGKLGLRLAFLHQSATAVWPPTGISIAAVLLFGTRIWPGLFIGAFLVNITITSLPVTIAIAVGNTLEPLLCAWLARRVAHGRHAFQHPRDTLRFLWIAVFSTTVSATFGVTSLTVGGDALPSHYVDIWLTWWLGDLVSAVIVTPFILIWSTIPLASRTRRNVIEAVLMLFSIVLVGLFVFSGMISPSTNHHAWLFLCFPSLLWASYRFGPHGAITASVALCGMAIWGALRGYGPMIVGDPNTSLVLLQVFMATITLTNLVLGCVAEERRRAEDALRLSEQAARSSESRKRAVLESALDAIITTDGEGRIVDFNPASEQMFGYRRADVLGRTVAETIIPIKLRDSHWRGLNRYKVSGEHRVLGRRIEMSAIRADGAEFPVELAITATQSDGESVVFTAYLRDLSDRKREEKRHALRLVIAEVLAQAATTDEALTRILEAVCETLGGWCTSAIWTVDRQADVLRCAHFWHAPEQPVPQFESATRQRVFERGIGLPGRVWARAEPIWISDVLRDDNFPRAQAAADVGLHAAFGFPIVMGGEIFAVMEFFSQCVESPDIAMMSTVAEVGVYIGQFLDRRRAEEELRVSQQQLQLITHSMSALVTRCSRDFRYLWVSKPYADWLHRRPEEMVGRPIAEVIGEEAFFRLKPYFERVLGGETVSYDEEINFLGLGPRWIHAVYSPTSDASRRIDGWVAVVNDIHERVQIQKTLQEADRRKDEFLAILAHELRNPLAPVRTAVALLGRIASGDREVQELREMIDRQVTQMARLLDDLMDISRITSGKINIRKERVTLNTVVNTALESSRPHIEAQGHKLTITMPGEPIYLDADLTRLAQVFSNLLNNAAKYTERGGHIWLRACREGENAVVSVRDSGIGIPGAMLPHIFDMFVQVNATEERTHGGLGIGLTLVQRLVEIHGGRVAARSEGPGKGSEFVVSLPALSVQSESLPQTTITDSAWDVGPRHRILIADDNLDSASLLKRLLGMMGHEVRIAHDGLEALEIAKAFMPHAALLDIGMPKLNGYDLARKIRSHPGTKATLLVAMTGWGQDEDKRQAREAGFDHHLTKPMDVSTIEKLLKLIRASSSESTPIE